MNTTPCSLLNMLLAAALVILLSSCEDIGGYAGKVAATGPAASSRSESSPAESRPGLATKTGWTNFSQVQNAAFYRKASGAPDAVDTFHYNDETGAQSMMDALGGGHEHGGLFVAAGGRLRAGLVDASEDAYRHIEAGGERTVMGRAGEAYGIRLKNRTHKRIEVVVSVDGLDVMDGQAATARKHGYILESGQEFTIRGFRINNRSVKQFVFGSVGESVAAKKGQARNVGVIGLAVYEEDEAAAKAARLRDALVRGNAEAFH